MSLKCPRWSEVGRPEKRINWTVAQYEMGQALGQYLTDERAEALCKGAGQSPRSAPLLTLPASKWPRCGAQRLSKAATTLAERDSYVARGAHDRRPPTA